LTYRTEGNQDRTQENERRKKIRNQEDNKLILHRLANRVAEKMKTVEMYTNGAMRNAEEYNITGSEKAHYLVGPSLSAETPMIRVEQPPRTKTQKSTKNGNLNLTKDQKWAVHSQTPEPGGRKGFQSQWKAGEIQRLLCQDSSASA
jgi:hypothetical protein